MDTLANGVLVVDNPPHGTWRPADAWTLREDLRLGQEEEGPELFGSVAGIAVDPNGAIYVLDRQWSEVRAFDPDGTHRWTVGRKGAGPGEMADPIGLAIEPSREIRVADPQNGRYVFFATDGSYLRSTPRRLGGYSVPWTAGYDQAGRFFERTPAGLIQIDTAGIPVDTVRFPPFQSDNFLLNINSVSITAPVPFAPVQVSAWDPRGFLWVANSTRYRLHQLTLEGDTVRVIEVRDIDPLPVTADDRQNAIDGLSWFTRQGGRVDPRRIPDAKPYFSRIHVASDGHIWVLRTRAAADTTFYFDVFDPIGHLLGAVQSPSDLGSRPLFRADTIYSIETDSLGVRQVVRAVLQRPGR